MSTRTDPGPLTVSVGDVRLIASTATVGTVTAVYPKSATDTVPVVMSVGTFASPTFAANATRKSFWMQNVGTANLYLGLGSTPTATSYHFALATATAAHIGNGGIYFDSEWLGTVVVIADTATGTLAFGETT